MTMQIGYDVSCSCQPGLCWSFVAQSLRCCKQVLIPLLRALQTFLNLQCIPNFEEITQRDRHCDTQKDLNIAHLMCPKELLEMRTCTVINAKPALTPILNLHTGFISAGSELDNTQPDIRQSLTSLRPEHSTLGFAGLPRTSYKMSKSMTTNAPQQYVPASLCCECL